MNIISFDVLASTIQYCELLDLNKLEEFTVVWAKEQTAGIGQRGNRWESSPGENLTYSLILHPRDLAVADQYMLTKVLSLGICDWLCCMMVCPEQVRIKWPNDIYVGNRKICGILVSNRIVGGLFDSAICGIGFNVNQKTFSSDIPNPTSLSIITGRNYPLDSLLKEMLCSIEKRYRMLSSPQQLDVDYLERLYRLGEMADFCYKGVVIKAVIVGVSRFGHLQLKTLDGESLSCVMKEIQFVI